MSLKWIRRPEFAASDWPAGEMRGRRLPLPIAIRVMNARNVVGSLTLITPTVLVVHDAGAAQQVPFGIVRAYAVLEPFNAFER